MRFNELGFERKILPKDQELNEDRPYIDIIIDKITLADHLGIDEDDITPFGWRNNIHLELENARRLITFKRSKFPNGLQSAYVCARCGDEGCGAVMFEVVNHGSYVEWTNFVNSDGYPSEMEPDEVINVNSFYFEMGDYQRAIGQLLKMIEGKN